MSGPPPVDEGVSPYAGRDLTWLLEAHAAEHPDRELVVWRDLDGGRAAWTYAEVVTTVRAVAAGLARLGVRAGDRVGIHADNTPEFVLAWFAISRLGAVMVTTNTRSAPAELADYLARTGAAVVLTQPVHLDAVRAAAPTAQIVAFDLVGSPDRSLEGVHSFAALAATPTDGADHRAPPDPLAPAGIQFTSGTTARAKGVVWTQANYLWAGQVSAAHEGLRADDRHLVILPLYHTNAQSYSVMAALWVGATVVLVPRFSATAYWDVACAERATCCAMIPFAVKALRRRPIPDRHSFRWWGNGLVVPGWERTFGIPTVSWWGMTETVAQPIVSDGLGERRPLAMGRASAHYEVRVVDDDGAVLTAPAAGLLEVRGIRGRSLMLEYLDDPAATAATFTPDGWLRTGDRVEVTADGWFSFLERDKDVLKVGGENVAALEVERVVGAVPGVDEVAVVAGRHPMLDEVPVAFVLPAPDGPPVDEGIVLDRCRAELADFKVPHAVVVVDELPRSTLAKVAKNVLRADADRLLAERQR